MSRKEERKGRPRRFALYNEAAGAPLYGLVLTGGKSTRMHKDKSLLNYHGKSQVAFCYDLLGGLCERVFISNRQDQAHWPGHKALPQIHDRPKYQNIGPLAGILSAMDKYPNVAWLVLACDLPYVKPKTLEVLLKKRNPLKIATAYLSSHDGLPEPLCAIYEPRGHAKILDFLQTGIVCPRQILIRSDIELLDPQDKTALDNINDPEEYKAALKKVQHGG